ncbi:hypothetical protein K431DRAFT_309248 [Polychaeton citri CBS 116435]|uniref:ATP-grasp domain-containing protein n=1 Tax=Polychaeton citri CBS 116435 TaxID=1314669 RepID=A0A9P4QIR3_9PEZI|nr:hypothetical protein K431DRAFT_309248 [Polychaeton citri CBS 116435]
MALDVASSTSLHRAQNIVLILLSIALLPLDTYILFVSYFLRIFTSARAITNRRDVRGPHTTYFQPRNILVTGVGMTKGLALARIFFAAGHNVIGADFEPSFIPTACGRTSRALRAFYKLAKPSHGTGDEDKYTQSILDIVRNENIDIWVSCSGVASAIQDGIAKEAVEFLTKCKCVQYDVATTKKLHEKHSFIDYTRSLNLSVPETNTVTSKAAALHVLDDVYAAGSSKRYVMKYIGTDDAFRGDMTLLPLPTPAETKQHISRLPISEERPWILQQYISGPEFCTHALVVRGEVKAFVACPSAELLMHYEALAPESALSQSMLRFTQEFAAAGGASFTGHLSFDFLVEDMEVHVAERDPARNVKLYPIECNPRAHTAVCLFSETPELADSYLTLLKPVKHSSSRSSSRSKPGKTNGLAPKPLYPRQPTKNYYWIGHDLVEMVFLPIISLFVDSDYSGGLSFNPVFERIITFFEHLLLWKDGTFELWDPLPAWWLYHVYWPLQFVLALICGQKWSRVNVSTSKMFMC